MICRSHGAVKKNLLLSWLWWARRAERYENLSFYFPRSESSVILFSIMSKSAEELIPLFKGLGITEYEAKVYLSLLKAHPASAYTISRNSGDVQPPLSG